MIFANPFSVPDAITEAMSLVDKNMHTPIALHRLINDVTEVENEIKDLPAHITSNDIVTQRMQIWRNNYQAFVTNDSEKPYASYTKKILEIVAPCNEAGHYKDYRDINRALYNFVHTNKAEMSDSLVKRWTDVGKGYKDENTL
jgi:hypothetical protein